MQSLTCVTEDHDADDQEISFETYPHPAALSFIPRSVSDSEAMAMSKSLDEIPDAPSHAGLNLVTGGQPEEETALTSGWEKTFHIIVFSKMVISKTIDMINGRLNRISKDFRFVADKLRVEKKRMKTSFINKLKEYFAEREAGGILATPGE